MDNQNSIFTCPVFDLTFRYGQSNAFRWTTKFQSGQVNYKSYLPRLPTKVSRSVWSTDMIIWDKALFMMGWGEIWENHCQKSECPSPKILWEKLMPPMLVKPHIIRYILIIMANLNFIFYPTLEDDFTPPSNSNTKIDAASVNKFDVPTPAKKNWWTLIKYN